MLINMKMTTFLTGALLYPCMEILYRRRTHPSMAVAGGLSLCALRRAARLPLPWPVRALAGASSVTAIEYLIGLAANRRHQVWDYRKLKGNLAGQICPQYFALWYAFALVLTKRNR